ncbi:MAG: hypothetical protein SGI99_17750 [Pseudomonadota bacterium]|nr:hypothetical protein [Pseudomonadota bacterium]
MMRPGSVLCALLVAGLVRANDGARISVETDGSSAFADTAAVLLHNQLVSNDEIDEYFEFMLRPDANALTEWRNLLPAVRDERIAQYRSAHDEAQMRIPVLRDMSPKERSELEHWAPYLAERAASASSARDRLLTDSDDDYRTIIAAGIKLIAARHIAGHAVLRHGIWTPGVKDFPQEIAFLRPEFIRVTDDRCAIFLHKGIGRGIGYEVRLHEDERWIISSFDEYESWQRTEIKLRDE